MPVIQTILHRDRFLGKFPGCVRDSLRVGPRLPGDFACSSCHDAVGVASDGSGPARSVAGPPNRQRHFAHCPWPQPSDPPGSRGAPAGRRRPRGGDSSARRSNPLRSGRDGHARQDRAGTALDGQRRGRGFAQGRMPRDGRQNSCPGRRLSARAKVTANPGEPIDVRPLGALVSAGYTRTLVHTGGGEACSLDRPRRPGSPPAHSEGRIDPALPRRAGGRYRPWQDAGARCRNAHASARGRAARDGGNREFFAPLDDRRRRNPDGRLPHSGQH